MATPQENTSTVLHLRVVCAVLPALHTTPQQYLVARRAAHKPHPGVWEFVGGKVDATESDQQALEREVQEELGLAVRAVSTLPSIEYPLLGKAGQPLHIMLVPVVCAPLPKDSSLTSTDHDALRWCTAAEMAELPMHHGDRKLAEYLGKHTSGQ